uniref:Uncharacterized protein n=1 Tax=Klebsiella phage vB_KpnM_Iguana_ER37 TaxID=3076781 RepID=A0AB38Z368_9CAUD
MVVLPPQIHRRVSDSRSRIYAQKTGKTGSVFEHVILEINSYGIQHYSYQLRPATVSEEKSVVAHVIVPPSPCKALTII